MLRKQEITVYNQIKDETSQDTYIKEVLQGVYVEEQAGRSLKETGLLDNYTVYFSIPYSEKYMYYKDFKKLNSSEKINYYTLEPKKTIIVVGNCELNYEDFESKSEFLTALTEERCYTVQTVDERLHCSKRLWHIEVGGV